jgi:CRISPR-associated protein Cas6
MANHLHICAQYIIIRSFQVHSVRFSTETPTALDCIGNEDMTTVDLAFPVKSLDAIPADHGYLLYSALSRELPEVHESNAIAVHPIRGRQDGVRGLILQSWSAITLRVNDDQIGGLLRLVGKTLRIGPANVTVDFPRVMPLITAPSLRSRFVTTKNGLDLDRFSTEIRRQMAALGISDAAKCTPGKRRTFRIKTKEIVGFELIVEGLTASESLVLQERGLGGRRLMTCGVFVPLQ